MAVQPRPFRIPTIENPVTGKACVVGTYEAFCIEYELEYKDDANPSNEYVMLSVPDRNSDEFREYRERKSELIDGLKRAHKYAEDHNLINRFYMNPRGEPRVGVTA